MLHNILKVAKIWSKNCVIFTVDLLQQSISVLYSCGEVITKILICISSLFGFHLHEFTKQSFVNLKRKKNFERTKIGKERRHAK